MHQKSLWSVVESAATKMHMSARIELDTPRSTGESKQGNGLHWRSLQWVDPSGINGRKKTNAWVCNGNTATSEIWPKPLPTSQWRQTVCGRDQYACCIGGHFHVRKSTQLHGGSFMPQFCLAEDSVRRVECADAGGFAGDQTFSHLHVGAKGQKCLVFSMWPQTCSAELRRP